MYGYRNLQRGSYLGGILVPLSSLFLVVSQDELRLVPFTVFRNGSRAYCLTSSYPILRGLGCRGSQQTSPVLLRMAREPIHSL